MVRCFGRINQVFGVLVPQFTELCVFKPRKHAGIQLNLSDHMLRFSWFPQFTTSHWSILSHIYPALRGRSPPNVVSDIDDIDLYIPLNARSTREIDVLRPVSSL